MQKTVRWTAAGTLALLALPLVALQPLPTKIHAQSVQALCAVPWPSTPTQTALREAAAEWALALQGAYESADEAREALRQWDPEAPFEERKTWRQLMMADAGGQLATARAALQKAKHLAQTPTERERVQKLRRKWEAVLSPI